MSQGKDSTTDEVDPAIALNNDETVEWTGRPRKTVILPTVVAGLFLVVAGIVGTQVVETALVLVLVPIGLATPLGPYLVNRNTQYAVTNHALYVKRGVLSRAVSQANLETVQNSSYTQSITGSLFGYGSVEFEIAGGSDLTFRAIERPQEVRALVDRASGSDGITGASPRTSELPGRLDQWMQVRDEVRAVRQMLER